MSDKTYNGWTNYATWRVRLEMFDGLCPYDITGKNDPYLDDLRDALKELAEQVIVDTSMEGLARDYALSFLSEVNWHEIAEHMIEDYALPPRKHMIADMGCDETGNAAANARLIAAAPELLAALQSIVAGYQAHFDAMPVAWQTYDNIARAAIAKAEG